MHPSLTLLTSCPLVNITLLLSLTCYGTNFLHTQHVSSSFIFLPFKFFHYDSSTHTPCHSQLPLYHSQHSELLLNQSLLHSEHSFTPITPNFLSITHSTIILSHKYRTIKRCTVQSTTLIIFIFCYLIPESLKWNTIRL